MITELIESLPVDLILPTEKDINSVLKKLKKGKKLTFEDNLTISKLRFCRIILDKKQKNIKI